MGNMGLKVSKKADISGTPKKNAVSAESAPVTEGTIEKLPESPEKPTTNGDVVVTVVDNKDEVPAVTESEKVEGQTDVEEAKEDNDKSIEKSTENSTEQSTEKSEVIEEKKEKEKKVKKKKSFRSFSFLRKKKEKEALKIEANKNGDVEQKVKGDEKETEKTEENK